MYCWDRHERLSVIGALSVAARRRRIGLYFVVYERNVTAEEVEAFLRDVQRSLGRRLIVVMDRWAAHRKAVRALDGDKRFWIEWLPPYAPDLNPVDKLWAHTKHDDLANYIPDDVLDLELELEGSFVQTRERPDLLRSFFHAARLGI
jgi:transposase